MKPTLALDAEFFKQIQDALELGKDALLDQVNDLEDPKNVVSRLKPHRLAATRDDLAFVETVIAELKELEKS